MSKKETEFDRYDRMRKLEKESEVQKKKNSDVVLEDLKKKKGGKPKPPEIFGRKNRSRGIEVALEEYDYV